jgi:inorganic pyrophosphatase
MDIIIETPKGSPVKYKYDQEKRQFKLLKALPEGMIFPFDFGFVPGTRGEDEDPLDIIVISEFSSFPGCVVEGRLIGSLMAVQQNDGKEIRNDRYVAVMTGSRIFGCMTDIKELPPRLVEELKQFFINYLRAEGKELEIPKVLNEKEAFSTLYRQVE